MFKTIILSLLFASLVFGEEEKDYPFVGISISTHNINTSLENVSWENGVSLKYGQQSLSWRTILALDYTQDSYFGGHIEIDKILVDNMFGTAKLRPYIGAVLGYMSYDKDNLNIPTNLTPEEITLFEETDSLYYGAKLGLIVYASDNIDIDISYHYYSVQDLNFVDELHGATLSLHYFF